MKKVMERPILMQGDMVRATLADLKTQTRRVAKLNQSGRVQLRGKQWHVDDPNAVLACPYGQPGDRLWVREAHHLTTANLVIYRADYPENAVRRGFENIPPESEVRWRPSIHMPRWASRILLEIIAVRFHRLHEISEEDIDAEGRPSIESFRTVGDLPTNEVDTEARAVELRRSGWFPNLWDSINAARGHGWDVNDRVWAVSYRRLAEYQEAA